MSIMRGRFFLSLFLEESPKSGSVVGQVVWEELVQLNEFPSADLLDETGWNW